MGDASDAAAAVEAALASLHTAMGTISAYVAASERQHAPDLGMAHEPHRSHAEVLDAFLRYTRFLVAAADADVLRPGPPLPDGGLPGTNAADAAKANLRPLTAEQCASAEAAHLRMIVETLTQDLSDELAELDNADGHRRRLTDQLEALRLDASLVKVYQGRVRELLRMMGSDDETLAQRLTEIAADTEREGLGEGSVRDEAATGDKRRSAIIATELGRLAANMKDKLDRAKAESAKLHADRTALIAENAILFQRVAGLEERIAALSAQQSTTLKELDRTRVRAAQESTLRGPAAGASRRSATPTGNSTRMTVRSGDKSRDGANGALDSSLSGVVGPSSIRIGDVVIDRDVALWMKDMYATLAADPETSSLVPSAHKQSALHPSRARASSAGSSATSGSAPPQVSRIAKSTPQRGTGFADHVHRMRAQDPS